MFKLLEAHLEKHKEKKEMRESMQSLIDESTITVKFILFSILSGLIAALGIMMDNVTILIGAMLIAPLLIPVISLSVGVGAGSIKLLSHSIKALTIGMLLALGSSMLMTVIVAPAEINRDIYASFGDTYLYAIVAFIAGVVAVYSWFKPKMNQVIPGVAIAVALVPPIAFAGTIIVLKNQYWLADVLQLIFINLGGIFLGGLLTFLTFAFVSKRPTLEVEKQVHIEVEKKEK